MSADTYLVPDVQPVVEFASPIANDDDVFWPRSSYHEDDEGTIYFRVQADRDLEEDAIVEFDFAGTAEMHVDFSQLVQSPITIPAGAGYKHISVKLLRDTRFWTERELQVRIRSVTGGGRMGRFNIFRAYLRSTLVAPFVAHDTDVDLDIANGDPATPITIELSVDNLKDYAAIAGGQNGNGHYWTELSREDSSVPYELGGTATEGVDYTISPASPLTIPAGASSVELEITTLDPASAKTIIVTLAPEFSARRNLLSYSAIGPGMKNGPWLRDDPNYPGNPWEQSYGKPSDWWMGCNNVAYGAGLLKVASLRTTTSGTNPDGTPAYRYHTHASPGCSSYGCILKEFDGDDVGAAFDLIRDLAAVATRWAALSVYVKESDSEYFSITVLDRTVQASLGTAAATHAVVFRWVAGTPTVYSTQNLNSPSQYGLDPTDPLVGAGWHRVYLAWNVPADNDGDILQTIIRPVDIADGAASQEHGTFFWGAQFEWLAVGGGPSDYQPVDGMHFWPQTKCIPGLISARTINLLGP